MLPARRLALPVPLPGRHELEVRVVAQGLALGGLVLLAQVAAARLVAVQRVDAHQLGELEEVGDPAGPLQLLVELVGAADDPQVAPELLAQRGDELERLLQPLGVAGDAAVVPDDAAELAVEGVGAAGALDREEPADPLLDVRLGAAEVVRVGRERLAQVAREVVADRVRDHEVAVGEPLHQRARAEAVGAVVGEVRLAERVEPGDVGHQVVVDPQAAHGVVRRRVHPHRHDVGVLAGDLLVHGEEVAVALLDRRLPQPLDGVGEVEVDAVLLGPHAAPLVDHRLGVAGGDVAGDEVAEARVLALQVVVPLGLGDLVGPALVVGIFGHPDPAVVAQRLGHQRQLRLVVARGRDAGRMDLRVAGVGEQGAAAVGPPGGGDVRPLGVGREVVDVAVAAGRQHHGVAGVALDRPGHHVAGDDPDRAAAAVDHHVEHLGAREHPDLAGGDLLLQGLVGAEQELLAGLAAGVEGAGDLGAAEGAVVEQAAVLAGEGDPLRHALVDDVDRHLGQPVDVGLAGAEVASLDGVVEEPEDAVAVVVVVLGGVDPPLGGDRVGAAGGVLEAEAPHLVAELGEAGRGRGPGEAGAHHQDREFPLVVGVDQLEVPLVLVPLVLDGTGGDLAVERRRAMGERS